MLLHWNCTDKKTTTTISHRTIGLLLIQLLFALCLSLSAIAQMTFAHAIKHFQKQYPIYFSFNQNIAQELVNSPIYSKDPLETQLDRVLYNTPIVYEKINENIFVFIRKAEKKEKDISYTWQLCIKDSSTHKTISDVSVYQKGQPLVFSNQEGMVQVTSHLANLPIEIRRIGYKPISRRLTIAQTSASHIIYIAPIPNVLAEVEINAQQQATEKTTVYTDFIPLRKATYLPSIFGRDIYNSLQYTAGVSSVIEPATGLYVRGTSPDQTLSMFDNILLFNADHALSTHSFINADVLTKINFHKKYITARLGGRTSSFLESNSKSIHQFSDTLKTELSFLGASVVFEKNIHNKVGIITSIRQVLPSFYLKEISKTLINNRNLLPQEQNQQKTNFGDITNSVSVVFSSSLLLKATSIHSYDKFSSDFSIENKRLNSFNLDKNNWKSYGYSMQLSKYWHPKITTIVASSISGNKKSISSESVGVQIIDSLGNTQGYALTTQTNKNIIARLAVDNSIHLKKSTWSVGIQNDYYQNRMYAESAVSEWLLNPNDSLKNFTNQYNSVALYAETTFLIKNQTHITIGGRMVQYGYNGKMTFEPRLQLNSVLGSVSSALYYTKLHQGLVKITLNTIPTHFNGIWYLVDGVKQPLMGSETIGFSLINRFNNCEIQVDAYYKKLTNIIELKQKYFTNPSNTFEFGSAKIFGVEYSLKRETAVSLLRFDYSFTRNRYKFADISDNQWFDAPYIPLHEFDAILMYKIRNFHLTTTWTLGVNRPFALRNQWRASTQENEKRLKPQDYNSFSLNNYHRLDLSVDYFPASKWQVHLNVQNIYNRRNEWYKTYTDGVINTKYQLGILPNLAVAYFI